MPEHKSREMGRDKRYRRIRQWKFHIKTVRNFYLQATASAADLSNTRRIDGWRDRWVINQVLSSGGIVPKTFQLLYGAISCLFSSVFVLEKSEKTQNAKPQIYDNSALETT